MDMLRIMGLGIAGALISVLLKEYKPVYAATVGMVTGAIIFFFLLSEISYIFDVISLITSRLSLNADYLTTIIRIIGIAYLARFGGDICRDAGQNTIAQKIELAGKVTIVSLSIPILTSVLNLLIGILPN